MSSVITKSSKKKGQETSKCNLDRDCIKSRRDKIRITRRIMMHQVHIVQLPNKEGDVHTWCIMICLVILILSLLLFIQSLYSLSKLQIYL